MACPLSGGAHTSSHSQPDCGVAFSFVSKTDIASREFVMCKSQDTERAAINLRSEDGVELAVLSVTQVMTGMQLAPS